MIEEAKKHFFKYYDQTKDCGRRLGHVESVENLTKKILADYPEADKEVVLISVWLHDIGSYIGDEEQAINSESETKKFLNGKLNKDKIEKIAHCVRAHRAKDVKPNTIEAKILAVADAESHFTRGLYMQFYLKKDKDAAVSKLERDLVKIRLIPKESNKFMPLYEAWKKVLELLPD